LFGVSIVGGQCELMRTVSQKLRSYYA